MHKEMLQVEWSGKVYTGMNRKQLALEIQSLEGVCVNLVSHSQGCQ